MTSQENSAARERNIPQTQRSVGEGSTGREAARPVSGPRRRHEIQGGGPSIIRFIDSAYPRSSPARLRLILLF